MTLILLLDYLSFCVNWPIEAILFNLTQMYVSNALKLVHLIELRYL